MTSDAAKLRILAIHAHPDDIELQCAGALLRLKALGHDIFMATMTPGDCGSAELTCDAIAAVRREEARQSAELIGAEYTCLEFRDLSIVHDNPSRRRVTEYIRRVRPDVVITAPPVDYMSDHEVTSKLVRDACFNASCPNYVTQQWDPAPAAEKIPFLYYVDAIEGIDWYGRPQPVDLLVDVSEVFERKLEMLACHASQREWLRRQHGLDEYLDGCRRWCGTRGKQIGTEYAEAYRQHIGHPYPHDDILLKLLQPGATCVRPESA